MKRVLWAVTLLLLITSMVYVAIFNDNKEEVIAQDNFIEIQSSEIFSEVNISQVTMTSPGFVVAREMINKKIGQIIEISPYLETGTHADISIPLYAEYEPNTLDVSGEFPIQKEVIVFLYKDNGDKGFNPTSDSIVTDGENSKLAFYVSSGSKVENRYLKESTLTEAPENTVEVIYTEEGFTPAKISIDAGETVQFVNKSNMPMWVASDSHPQHDILSSFDQYSTSQPNESYWYTFEQKGVWKYHDHVNASMEGVVIVN